METVIAILVLAVLLTGFLTVFTPAAQGIRRAISTQQADRLKATLEKDMATLREGEKTADIATGFDKAFTWIQEGHTASTAIFVYQYRGNKALSPRADGTLQPMTIIQGKPGIDYVTQTAARRADDDLFIEDLDAVVGPVFYVKPTQLVYNNNELVLSDTPGQIENPEDASIAANPDDYTDAVIAFSASFYMVPSVSANYLTGSKFAEKFASVVKPVFVRNLAVRR
jgi:hypothetical protein